MGGRGGGGLMKCVRANTLCLLNWGGGGGGKGQKVTTAFPEKILNLVRLNFERKIFRLTFFANLAQPFKLEDFCENFVRKNLVFLPPARFQNRITSKNSTRTFFTVHAKNKNN